MKGRYRRKYSRFPRTKLLGKATMKDLQGIFPIALLVGLALWAFSSCSQNEPQQSSIKSATSTARSARTATARKKVLIRTPTPSGGASANMRGRLRVVRERVNVREGPGTEFSIIGTVAQGDRFTIMGKNRAGDWYKLCCLATEQGWIYGPLVEVENGHPVTVAEDAPLAPTPSGPYLTVTKSMNIRDGPGTNYPVVGGASPGQHFPLTGRNAAGDWWQINYNGSQAWAFGQLVSATGVDEVKVAASIPTPPPAPQAPTESPGGVIPGTPGIITRVIDGDTIDVTFNDGTTERIRFFDVNTPETRGGVECFGPQASQFTESFHGQRVGVESRGRDRYNRLLAYIWLPDGRLLNEELTRGGYARYRDYGNPGKYAARVRAAAQQAQRSGAGLWSHC